MAKFSEDVYVVGIVQAVKKMAKSLPIAQATELSCSYIRLCTKLKLENLNKGNYFAVGSVLVILRLDKSWWHLGTNIETAYPYDD